MNLVGLNESLFNKIRGDKIGMIFQDPLASLNPLMRVGDQVAETLYYHTDMNEKQRKARVIELFNQVGIPTIAKISSRFRVRLTSSTAS